MPPTGQFDEFHIANAVAQIEQTRLRDQHIALGGHNQHRDAYSPQPWAQIALADQPESVSHHALVGLPTVPDHKVELRPGMWAAAEKEPKELVDESVLGRQRIPGQRHICDQFHQVTLKACPDALDAQAGDSVRETGGKLKTDYSAE